MYARAPTSRLVLYLTPCTFLLHGLIAHFSKIFNHPATKTLHKLGSVHVWLCMLNVDTYRHSTACQSILHCLTNRKFCNLCGPRLPQEQCVFPTNLTFHELSWTSEYSLIHVEFFIHILHVAQSLIYNFCIHLFVFKGELPAPSSSNDNEAHPELKGVQSTGTVQTSDATSLKNRLKNLTRMGNAKEVHF